MPEHYDDEQVKSFSESQAWVEVRRKHRVSDAHVQMAPELGMNPKKLGGLANHPQEPWKRPEARFKLASKTGDEIVFENPAHDFPQRIRYRREGDALHARVEGTMKGKQRGIDFPYQRVACSP